mmetsp:Transcript_10183/g.37423  ORF Transcript_10183/g.37423 Transcript_10183/m.37423 type:complete len:221 (-) Transcript_10183:1295-1957(-)
MFGASQRHKSRWRLDARARKLRHLEVCAILAQTATELRHILQASARVCGVVPGSTTSTATALPHMNELVKARVVLLEDRAVVVLLLALRGVDRELLRRASKRLVADGLVTHVLELLNPGHANALALHRLRPPQHRIGNFSIEEGAKRPLLRPIFALDLLEPGIHTHYLGDNLRVQERYAGFKGVRHGHTVSTLAVHVVQVVEDTAKLLEKCGLVGSIAKV